MNAVFLKDSMAMVKLNLFHWHITDSHSWPMSIKSHSYLSDYGAYTETKIYTADDIKEVESMYLQLFRL